MLRSRSATHLLTARSAIKLLIVGVLSCSSQGAAQRPKANTNRTVTLDGTTLKLPKGYKLAPTQPSANSVLLLGQDQNGIFFVVTQGANANDPSEIVKYVLKQLYSKDSQQYSWKEMPLPKRLSKFELSGLAVRGYNGNQLVSVKFRHVAIGEKVLTVGEIIEIARGNEARTIFEGNLEAISLGLCNVFIEVVFPLTKEKLDPRNPPCELVADVETVKPGSER
jgi:hypothetical protein